MNPRFPIYIPSKGRWESRLSAKCLSKLRIPFHIIIEEQEYENYRAVIDPSFGTILILDKSYQDNYDAFSNLGVRESKGSGPARNFAWDHAVKSGAEWHWCMDDNIQYFFRMNQNRKNLVRDGTILRCMEDFVLRYENIGMAGPQYDYFAPRKKKHAPLILNTRIYSCNLIRNDIPFRWRGRYNEDTDLSIRILKAGWCTVLFNAFLQKKITTGKMKGGNSLIYSKGTRAKSQMLADMHPDIVKVVWRYNRWHHQADYNSFKWLKLKFKPGIEIKSGVDNFGMQLQEIPYEGSRPRKRQPISEQRTAQAGEAEEKKRQAVA